MMLETIKNESLVLAFVLLINLLIIGFGVFSIYLIRELTKKISIEYSCKIRDKCEKEILGLIDSIVISTNQTVVEKLKEETQDGKLTKEDATKILSETRDSIMKCLSEIQKEYIINLYGDLANGLNVLIEQSVSKNHK